MGLNSTCPLCHGPHPLSRCPRWRQPLPLPLPLPQPPKTSRPPVPTLQQAEEPMEEPVA